MMKCREASEMASRQLDLVLGPGQRLRLRLHLMLCRYCRNYARQLAFLHRVAPQLQDVIEQRTDIRLSAARKEAIRQSLEAHD